MESFTAMFFLGVATAIVGAASKNIGLSAQEIGYLVAVQNIGFIISVLITGNLADSQSKTLLMGIGSVVLGAGIALFFAVEPIGWNLLVMFGIGVGSGACEGSSDAMLLDIHTHSSGKFITINHFFVTFGGFAITLYLIYLNLNWRNSMIQSGIVLAVLAFFLFLSRAERRGEHAPVVSEAPLPEQESGLELREVAARFVSVLKKPKVLRFFFAAVFAVALEIGTISMLTAFLVDYRGFGLLSSKLMLASFLGGMSLGRIVLGSIVGDKNIRTYVILLFIAATVLSVFVYILPLSGSLLIVVVVLLGISISALLPMIIAMTGLAVPDAAGTSMGLVKLGIPISGILIPLIISGVSAAASLPIAMILLPVCGVISVVLLLKSKESG